jgi:hypothetical protein
MLFCYWCYWCFISCELYISHSHNFVLDMISTFGNLQSTTERMETVFNIIVLTSGLLLVTMLIGNIKVHNRIHLIWGHIYNTNISTLFYLCIYIHTILFWKISSILVTLSVFSPSILKKKRLWNLKFLPEVKVFFFFSLFNKFFSQRSNLSTFEFR